ncbi:hypothetical protein K435DRAFT_782524 [Dendrothele bispora CBS 962.96]|uniref:CFEM domain-containing protein n=1 Tax=Dendrothele bispora (strain CBS 962.96) TaxID=1314807 RepID=A0A4V4HDK1_DENBC|nr:hypothetical protein K435DRAFT_782524 [Dendrothele bispora CBS 962.96]
MRFSKALLLTALATASSASVLMWRRQDIPQCALKCRASTDPGGCDLDDSACLCKNEDFVTNVKECITDTCDADDVATSLEIIEAQCAAAGVPIDA